MTVQEQLELWVKGESLHNPTRDECCPDFSCCDPGLKWPEDKRKLFAKSSPEQQEQMLFGALGDLVKTIHELPGVN